MLSIWAIWLLVGLALVIIEFFTLGFGVLCFSFGCFAACLLSLCVEGIAWQIAIFSVVSLICFVFIRPSIQKLLGSKEQVQTNADALIGAQATVIEAVSPTKRGLVKIDGDTWQATSTSDEFAVGAKVKVASRDGLVLTIKSL